MRGCGAGLALAHHPYHSGRSDDIRQALKHLSERCAGSPLTLLAFSLSANTALKMLGESEALPTALDQAIVVSPPVDLARCVASLANYPARAYDRFFTSTLLQQVQANPRLSERASYIFSHYRPTRLIDFDDMFTAPLSGFGTAAQYYARCSANQFLARITIPTTIIIAKDDPIVPLEPITQSTLSSSTTLITTTTGGHLGFIATGARRRWMDHTVRDLIVGKR
jgi:predicted alpha/beta-fold hydrolase